MNPRTSTKTLIKALNVLANDIQSEDGIANAVIAEAAQRMQEMLDLLQEGYEIVDVQYHPISEFNKNWKMDWMERARNCGVDITQY